MAEYIQVVTTVSTRKAAENIAKSILTKKLAACVQILGPVKSSYWWEKKITKNTEYVCLIKTKRFLYEKLENEIVSMHQYEVPEILAFEVSQGNMPYLKWIDESLME